MSGEVTPYKLTSYTIDTIRLGPQRAGPRGPGLLPSHQDHGAARSHAPHLMKADPAYPHWDSITLRWLDNDTYGHVNNVHHYSFFDTAVTNRLADMKNCPQAARPMRGRGQEVCPVTAIKDAHRRPAETHSVRVETPEITRCRHHRPTTSNEYPGWENAKA